MRAHRQNHPARVVRRHGSVLAGALMIAAAAFAQADVPPVPANLGARPSPVLLPSEILDATSAVARPGMSPGQYGIAIALRELAASGSPQEVLAADAVAPSFRTAPYSSRLAFAVYGARISAAASCLSALEAKSTPSSSRAAADLKSAEHLVYTLKVRLDRSLNGAEHASPASWDQARIHLADDYQAYAIGVAQVERLARR